MLTKVKALKDSSSTLNEDSTCDMTMVKEELGVKENQEDSISAFVAKLMDATLIASEDS